MATAHLPPFDLRVIYPWMHPSAVFAAQFQQDQYWLDAAGGPIAAADLLSTTRSSGINLPDAAGVYQSIGVNILPRTDRGLYGNGQFTQHAVNWNAPANESISLGTGTFTLTVWGGGSVTVAAGTATGSGFGVAADGTPVTFTISGAGTISLTVTGSPDYVNVTNTAFASPAPQPTGTVLASDIRAVQGVRPSNSQAEPFAGWEAAGLDGAFGGKTIVTIDRLNAAAARFIAGAGVDADNLWKLTFDTDNRFKLIVRKSGVDEVALQTGEVASTGDKTIEWQAKPGDYGIDATGVAGDTDSDAETLPAGSTTLRIGSDFGVLNPFNGWIKELQILGVAA